MTAISQVACQEPGCGWMSEPFIDPDPSDPSASPPGYVMAQTVLHVQLTHPSTFLAAKRAVLADQEDAAQ